MSASKTGPISIETMFPAFKIADETSYIKERLVKEKSGSFCSRAACKITLEEFHKFNDDAVMIPQAIGEKSNRAKNIAKCALIITGIALLVFAAPVILMISSGFIIVPVVLGLAFTASLVATVYAQYKHIQLFSMHTMTKSDWFPGSAHLKGLLPTGERVRELNGTLIQWITICQIYENTIESDNAYEKVKYDRDPKTEALRDELFKKRNDGEKSFEAQMKIMS